VSRASRIALAVTGLVLPCVIGVLVAAVTVGPSLPAAIGCPDAGQPTVGGVVDRPQRVKEFFPELTGVTTVHWQDREAVPRTCPQAAPMRFITTGLIVVAPSAFQGYGWEPAKSPDIPPDLLPYAPRSPQWTASRDFNAAMGGAFELDAASATLFFTHTQT
jgi:hypothetical protein